MGLPDHAFEVFDKGNPRERKCGDDLTDEDIQDLYTYYMSGRRWDFKDKPYVVEWHEDKPHQVMMRVFCRLWRAEHPQLPEQSAVRADIKASPPGLGKHGSVLYGVGGAYEGGDNEAPNPVIQSTLTYWYLKGKADALVEAALPQEHTDV